MEIIQRLRTRYPLKWLLGFAQLARSTFFAKRQIKPDKDELLKKTIQRIKAIILIMAIDVFMPACQA